ncbi:YicC/YloC family endoribonuclease [Hazenella coriacea]|uniref:Uncharacterized protein (TIGR00255 family) n=1 Tax=Hazenella coriacea TaxID=1179467 RepID=A0A4V2UUT4_9BACL|nr:YicC/YloC family endoribonuclease [Hazenella coriacea]TCS93067.1 uncharacterized protein (TIGR00255 family) [Hazenella coriacea]
MIEKKSSIISMTGYGRGEIEIEGIRIVTEVRSVNHRFLEVVVRLPQGWILLEEQIRKLVQQVVRRGRVDVFVSVEGNQSSNKRIDVDWEVVNSFLQASQQIEDRLGISANLTVADLIHKPECWIVEETKEEGEHVKQAITDAVEQACHNLKEMRVQEGIHLATDLYKRVDYLLEIVAEIKELAPLVEQQIRQRISSKLDDMLGGREVDQDRLLTEVAIYADKADITEECTRLESHVQQFTLALQANEPVGRRLEFLIQEMNREINTIGSKANQQTISSLVVSAKSELEKMKEQVQNIE